LEISSQGKFLLYKDLIFEVTVSFESLFLKRILLMPQRRADGCSLLSVILPVSLETAFDFIWCFMQAFANIFTKGTPEKENQKPVQ